PAGRLWQGSGPVWPDPCRHAPRQPSDRRDLHNAYRLRRLRIGLVPLRFRHRRKLHGRPSAGAVAAACLGAGISHRAPHVGRGGARNRYVRHASAHGAAGLDRKPYRSTRAAGHGASLRREHCKARPGLPCPFLAGIVVRSGKRNTVRPAACWAVRGGGGSGMRLVTSGVSKRFQGVTAVSDVSLACASGEIVGLIGPNGAGKTTLLNLISSLLRVDAGTITLDGRPVHNIGPRRIALAGVARTFQNIRLCPNLTVRQNIAIAYTTAQRHRRERLGGLTIE